MFTFAVIDHSYDGNSADMPRITTGEFIKDDNDTDILTLKTGDRVKILRVLDSNINSLNDSIHGIIFMINKDYSKFLKTLDNLNKKIPLAICNNNPHNHSISYLDINNAIKNFKNYNIYAQNGYNLEEPIKYLICQNYINNIKVPRIFPVTLNDYIYYAKFDLNKDIISLIETNLMDINVVSDYYNEYIFSILINGNTVKIMNPMRLLGDYCTLNDNIMIVININEHPDNKTKMVQVKFNFDNIIATAFVLKEDIMDSGKNKEILGVGDILVGETYCKNVFDRRFSCVPIKIKETIKES